MRETICVGRLDHRGSGDFSPGDALSRLRMPLLVGQTNADTSLEQPHPAPVRCLSGHILHTLLAWRWDDRPVWPRKWLKTAMPWRCPYRSDWHHAVDRDFSCSFPTELLGATPQPCRSASGRRCDPPATRRQLDGCCMVVPLEMTGH